MLSHLKKPSPMKTFLRRIFNQFSTCDESPLEIRRARQLIAAIDAGGIPLDPRRITRIAESLGLEVPRKARTEDTIERIRAALKRCE
jgi:hypothetical protein